MSRWVRWASAMRMRLHCLLQREKIGQELDDELQFHLQRQIEEYAAQGMSAEEARYSALRAFGGLDQRKDECRDARPFHLIDSLVQDVRYALRQLRRNPGFASVAVLTLALCIGANTAIFSVVDSVILRTLSYRDPGRLVAIHETTPQLGLMPVSPTHFLEWQKTTRSFEQMALLYGLSRNLTGGTSAPKRVDVGRVSPALFPMLGVRARLGRTFLRDEDQPGRGRVAVIDDALWKRQFGADSGVIGRKVMLDGTPYEIVGVLPAEFRFPKISSLYVMSASSERPEVWIPLEFEPFELRTAPLGDFNFACIARLKESASSSEALSEINVVQQRLVRQSGQKVDLSAAIVPLQDQIVSRSKGGLQLTLAASGIVLLIGCANIVNLLLARTLSRTREMAIRGAIGASRSRLIRQIIVEGLVLSSIGALLALIFAYVAIPLILSMAPADLPRLHEVYLDTRALAFAGIVSVLAGVLIGLLPARRSANVALRSQLATGSQTKWNPRRSRIGSSLLTSEIALSIVCLITSGLLLHSFVKLLTVDRGFETQHIVTVDVNLGQGENTLGGANRIAFADAVLRRLRAVPGVMSVAITDKLPLSGEGGNSVIYVDGPDLPQLDRPIAALRTVNTDYFRLFNIGLQAGRLFEETDRNHRRVALVSTSMAQRAWPGENPVGKGFRFRSGNPYEVIGVVSDVRGISLERKPALHVYFPYWQGSLSAYVSIAVKTATDPLALSSAIRTSIREVDPELPLSEFRTMDDVVTDSVAQRRFQLNLVLLFAAAAMVLVSLGIYGLMSYAVAQRTNEIGVRMALGAERTAVRRMVLADAFRVVAVGLSAGIPMAFIAAYSLRTLLFGIDPLDWPALSGSCLLLAASALFAAWLPARRASRVDPMVALRYD